MWFIFEYLVKKNLKDSAYMSVKPERLRFVVAFSQEHPAVVSRIKLFDMIIV